MLDRHRRLVWSFIFIALVIYVALIFFSDRFLLVTDDAYYYFHIARNVASGNGVVFNEGVVTNGFHPLYAAVLVVIYSLVPGLEAPISVALLFLVVCSLLTGWMLFLIVSRLWSRDAGVLASALWLLNPFVMSIVLMGVEVPLQMLLLSLFVLVVVRKNPVSFYSRGESLLLGVLGGLLFLARMDGVFLLVAFGLWVLWSRRSWGWRALLSWDLVVIALLSLSVVAPWLLWSLFSLGRFTPVSGEAHRVLVQAFANPLVSSLGALLVLFQVPGIFFLFVPFINEVSDVSVLTFVIFLVHAAIVFGLVVLALRMRAGLVKVLLRVGFLVLAAVLFGAYYVLYIIRIRSWYVLFFGFLLCLFLPMLFSSLHRRVRFVVLGLVLLFFLVGGLVSFFYVEDRFVQKDMALFLDSLPEGKGGSFNTGALQYYSRREVVNLDGVVNPDALAAMRAGAIDQYMVDAGVWYWLDGSLSFGLVGGDVFDCPVVAEFPVFRRHLLFGWKFEYLSSICEVVPRVD